MSNVRKTWSQNSSALPDGKNILYMSTNFAGVSLPFGQSCCNTRRRIFLSKYLLKKIKFLLNFEKTSRKLANNIIIIPIWKTNFRATTYFKSFVPFLYSRLVVSRVRFQKIHILFAQLIFAPETAHFAICNGKRVTRCSVWLSYGIDN